MHKFFTALTSLTLLSLTLFAAAQDNGSAGPSLTIYNQNFFVARDHLTLDLKPGANHIEFAGVTSHLEPDSVILRDLTGRPLQILEQSYRADPISQELLLSFYEGKTIDFQVQRGEKFETFPARSFAVATRPASPTSTATPREWRHSPSSRSMVFCNSGCRDSRYFPRSATIPF